MRANTKRRAWFAVSAGAVAFACLRPTEITVKVTAEPGLCAGLQTTIAVGRPGDVVPISEASARVTGCPRDAASGDLGSIVLVPSGSDRGARLEVRVVAALGKSPDACAAAGFAGCIEARRALRYARHVPLDLPIVLYARCIGVRCPDGTTCVDGRCFLYDSESEGYCDPASPSCKSVDGGADVGTEGGSDAGPPAACPSGRGPSMVRVTLPGSTFCIDATEVTGNHYAAFLATSPPPASHIAACAWKKEFGAAFPDDLPVASVDWCDANAFCAWAGKRLCKARDGSLPSASDASTGTTEWTLACSAGGRHIFPYGDTYDPEACRTEPAPDKDTNLRPVGLYPSCVGGFPGIFDLSGGVHEWTDGCFGTGGASASDLCRQQGGSYTHPAAEQTCVSEASIPRASKYDDLGFRCCAD